jgi:hypothetical protein
MIVDPFSGAHLSTGSVRPASAGRIHIHVHKANNSHSNCCSVAQSTIKRLTYPQVPGSWPFGSRWDDSTKRWTFRGLTCPSASTGMIRPSVYSRRLSFLQLRHQLRSRATRIKPSSLHQVPQLRNPVSQTTSFIACLAATGQIASAIPDSTAHRHRV